jgi:uncharacterized protein (TIGR03437 family)
MKNSNFLQDSEFLIPRRRKATASLSRPLRFFLTWVLALTLICQPLAVSIAGDKPSSPREDKTAKVSGPEKSAKPKTTSGSQAINPDPVTTVSAASYDINAIAPEAIVACFGTKLATRVEAASAIPLPTTLAGTTVIVKDKDGVDRPAPLFFVSPNQINYQIPEGTAVGQATVEVRSGDGAISQGMMTINAVGPAVFTANQDGQGVPAAQILRVKADGTQIYESLAEADPVTGRQKTKPVDLGPEGEKVFLILYLSGIRGAADANRDGNVNETIHLLIGGTETVPLYAGRQGGFVGLDQINNAELPRNLAGRGRVSLAISAVGHVTSNICEIEIASPPGGAPPQITSFNPAPGAAGQELTINGSGFSLNQADNIVRIGGVEAGVTFASGNQLRVKVPYGAESGLVTVRTPQGEGKSTGILNIATSISGIVETTSRQPLSDVTVKVAGTNITTKTDAEGTFVLVNVPQGSALIEVDASALPSSSGYPKIALRTEVADKRDNQFPQPIALQPLSNAGINIEASGLAGNESVSVPGAESAKAENAAVQSDNVTLDVPVGARVAFPDGSNSGRLSLTVVASARTPVRLPAGFFSSTIAQIAPFGATLDIGGKLTFPNKDGYNANETVRLFRLEQGRNNPNLGRFAEIGFATVSADGSRIETPDGVITETGYYFVAAQRQTTTIIGHVVEENGSPVRRVLVRSRGQESFTDGNGGFILRQAPVKSGDRISVEASYPRPKGRVERVQRNNATVTVSGVTALSPALVLPGETSNRPPVILALTSARAVAGQPTELDFIAFDRDSGQTIQVGVSGAAFASIISRGENRYILRLSPGINEVKDYQLNLSAKDNLNAETILPVSLSVLPPPPAIADFNPKNGCIGSAVTVTGVSLRSATGNPVVSFAGANGRRIQALVSAATATEVRVTVPNGATSGVIELSNEYGGPVRSGAIYTAEPSQDFEVLPAPSSATAVQGATATYVVSVASRGRCFTDSFTQLVSLSVSGIPDGAKASFNPERITAGATSTLSLALPGNMSPGSYTVTIKGKAIVDSNELERTASASLTVQATGQTTLSGRVLSTKNEPIMGATVSLDGQSTTTDASGSFLLKGITAGADRPVMVNGQTASAPGRTYPVINEPVTILDGQANIVPFTFYLPIIDIANQKEYKTGQPLIVDTPMAPGLKMMIPAEANLKKRNGEGIAAVSLTCVEPDRLPAPLPPNLGTTMVYTSQPGDVRPAPGVVIPVIYPNLAGADPGTRVELMNFDPDTTRWYRYGYGRVSKDGRLIEPEPGVGLPYFSWHFPNLPDPCDGGKCCDPAYQCCEGQTGNPVDLSAGMKIERATDIAFSGARGGLELTRTYTTNLAVLRPGTAFGRGTTHNYDIRLTGSFAEGGAGRFFQPEETGGRLFSYSHRDSDGALVFTTTETPHQLGDIIRKLSNGTFEYRYRSGNRLLFDTGGRLTAMIDRNGNTTTLTYTGGLLTRITDAVGRSITLEYSGSVISKATDPLGREWKYTYSAGQLATVTDPDDKVTRYGYDGNLGLISVTDKRGTVVKRITYDNRRVVRQDFADGGFERYTYEFAGNSVTGVTITNALNRVRSLRFNGAGQVIETTDELGQRAEIKRDLITNLPLERKGPCNCAEDTRKFDTRGNPMEITDQLGKTTSYEYDPVFSNVTKMTDRRGNVTTYTYDTRGNRLTMTNARNETTTYTYDQSGQLKTITDDLGHTIRMEYNQYGNVIERYDALNNLTKMEYDVVGNLKAITDPLQRRTEMTYDKLDRLKTVRDANNATTTYEYDPNGNQIAMTDALNRTWTSGYDQKNRLILRTDPLTRITRMRYNTADELTAMTTPSGRITIYRYDARGQRIELNDPLGNAVRFTYDNQRNLISLTDQRGNTTTFSYDELDRVIARRDPLGFATTFEYDPEGNVIATVDRLERRTTVVYDKLNRREQVTYVDATVNYSYDRAGRLTGITDTQGGPITWAYDDANRLLSETTQQGVVKYTYNNASQRATMTAADRQPVVYDYDAAGRLKTITQGSEVFTYTYDKLSRVERLDRPNGVKTEYSYDEVNRLRQLRHSNALNLALEDFQYSYNAEDEIDTIQSIASATRLPGETRTAGRADAANRIAQFGQASYTFDAEGQTRTKTEADGTNVYEWDARGRLRKVTLPGGETVSYGYDALGRRSNRMASGTTTTFLYDGQDVVLDRTGSTAVDYLNGFGIDDKLRQTSAGLGSLYFLRDHLGSTAALVNSMGSLIERGQYEAFGGSAGSSLTRYGFTSRELDAATGLMYYRARWYDTQQGRFLSEDPISFDGGLNLYAYSGNSPLNSIDPEGTAVMYIVIAVIAFFYLNIERINCLIKQYTDDCKKDCPCGVKERIQTIAKIKLLFGAIELEVPCGFDCVCK